MMEGEEEYTDRTRSSVESAGKVDSSRSNREVDTVDSSPNCTVMDMPEVSFHGGMPSF